MTMNTNERPMNRPLGGVAHARPYYEDKGMGVDALVRCADCTRLVTHTQLATHKGLTPCCGTRRVKEIRALSTWEWLKIRLGLIDFPFRAEFLKEFSRGGR